MPYKDKNLARKKALEYYYRNRDKILTNDKTPESRKQRREYDREYRNKNREKIRELSRKQQKEIRARSPEKYRENNRKCYWSDPERARLWAKKSREKVKQELFELLGNKCSNLNCAVPNRMTDIRALQVDHINGHGLEERKIRRTKSDSYYRYILKQIKSGSKKYQLLCANCNWIKKFENKETRVGDTKYV